MLMLVSRALLPLFLFSLLFPALSPAQPAISDIKVEAISHGTVAVRFQVAGLSGLTENWLEYGPSHLLGFRTAIWRTASASPFRSLAIGGLRPDTEYYFRVVAASATESATWYCGSGGDGAGYRCDGPDAPPRFRTLAAPDQTPVLPALPQVPEHPFPAIDGQSFSVAVDGNSHCLDFQEQLEAAAAADTSLNHEVVIPAGATCFGEFSLPRKLGAGVVLVRPSTPFEQLPPAGVRIDPSFRPLMATLSVTPDWRGTGRLWHLPLATPPLHNCPAPCTEGWRFVALEITHPVHSDIQPREARIASISESRPGASLVTLDRPFPLDVLQSVAIAGVAGAPALNGFHRVNPVSESSFVVEAAAPAEGASGGHVLQAIGIPVASCGPGPQPICTTALPHGLPQPEPVPIRAISGPDLDATAPTPWQWMTTVELRGAPSNLDGVWAAERVGNNLRLAGAAPTASCNGDCGTVQVRPAVQSFGFDEPKLNGSRLYTVISETEVRLDDIAEPTAESAGGFLSADPNSFPRLLSFEENARNIVLDRCWIHGRGFPTRIEGALALRADDSALLDSVVSDIHSWRPVSPKGAADSGAHGYFAGAATVVTLSDASRIEIRNNLFENCIGITIYAEQFRSTPNLTPSDIAIVGNAFRNSDRFRAGSDDSDGRYYAIRHAIEFKRGQRILIDGNLFDGNWADWTPLGPAIGLLTRGGSPVPNNRILDATIRNNVFRRVATAMQLSSTDDIIETPSLPAARIEIRNNLLDGVDFYKMRSKPSGVARLQPSGNFGGQIIFAGGSFEDLTVRHNTAIDNRGRSPASFWYRGGRSSGVAITDNIFTHNADSSAGGLPQTWHIADFESPLEGPPSAAFAHVFTQTPGPDPRSAFARNLILPGVRDSSVAANYDDGSRQLNFTKADCEAFYAGFAEIECAGSGEPGETAKQRFTTALPDRSDPRDAQGRGADLAQLPALAATIGDVSARAQDNSATVSYRLASPESCFVDIAGATDFAQFQRVQDGGGEQRTVTFENLAGGQTHRFRIKCASDTYFGEVDVP